MFELLERLQYINPDQRLSGGGAGLRCFYCSVGGYFVQQSELIFAILVESLMGNIYVNFLK